MTEGAGQRERVARALLLLSATFFTFVDTVLLYILITPSVGMREEGNVTLINMYLIGVVGLIVYFPVRRRKADDRNLLAFTIVAALAIFVLPVFAQAYVA